MRLSQLKIMNFKGIRELSLIVNGEDTTIFGANASGKTTLVDAVLWLLFDKDSLNQKNFEIKTLVDGAAIPSIEHSVEATFILSDGVLVKLGKIYKEKYTKRRGQPTKEFTGHTTDHYIDDVPVKLREYKIKVAEIATREDLFQLLTSPTFFSTKLGWQKQREILLEVCGDILDDDVITSTPDLRELPGILNGKSTDDYKKIVAGTRKKINEELNSIPDRIDEVSRTNPELAVTNAEALVGSLTKLRSLLAKKNREIGTIRGGGGVAELQLRRTEIAGRIQAIKNEHTRDITKASVGKTEELHALLDDIAETKAKTYSHKAILEQTPTTIRHLELENKALRERWAVIDEELFNPEICPTCDQVIRGEKADELQAIFNQKRAEKLEDIQTAGKENAVQIGLLENKMHISENELSKINDLVIQKQKQADRIKSEIDNSKASAPDLEELPEYVDAIKKQEKLQCEIESLGAGNSDLIVKVEKEKEVIEAQIAENEKKIAAIEQSHKCQDRISELKAQEKKLSADYEHLEGHLYLIEQFIRAKVSMLEQKINDKFSLVSFRLFKNQINEGLQECCEVTVDGVPFNSLNSAAKVQSGLDIIITLSEYYGFAPLVFIDNRESVTSIPEMKCQAISLVVSPKDKELRIEATKQLAEAA